MTRGTPDDAVANVTLSECVEKLRRGEQIELGLGKLMGISEEGVQVDSIAVRLAVKDSSHAEDGDLDILQELHNLRLQYWSDQRKVPVKLGACHSCPGLPYSVNALRFCAVLIGVDAYHSYPLNGCVSDALLMEKYLTKDLGVPKDRIKLLVGSKEHASPEDPMNPSRVHIISALLDLINNSEIAYGDNIIIYFSGHGSYYPSEEDGDEYIETLCPIDRDILDANGVNPVPDISDREFNTILHLIAQEKGPHITVILDCCHSGGASRGIPEPGARAAPPMRRATRQEMLLAGNEQLRGYPHYRSILDNFQPDMASHVLLAACMDYQYAKPKKIKRDGKTEGHIGIFTDALVRALRSGCWKKETTYVGLIRCLGQVSSHQTPVVAGKRMYERLFYQDEVL